MADRPTSGLRGPEGVKDPCDGCHECGLRCTAGVQMTRREFEQIAKYLRAQDARQVLRVLEQEKWVTWFEETETEACLFYDVSRRRCIAYPVRPLICRLFGRVEWLPCPIGKPLPRIREGLAVIQAYAGERRATFPEWCAEFGLFDFRALISA